MNRNQCFQYSEMILLALDGGMDDRQFAEFDRLLREDADFRRYYLQFMAVNTSLGAIDKFPSSRLIEDDDNAVLSVDLWSELARQEQTAETVEVEIPKQPPQIVKRQPVGIPPRKINKFSLLSALTSAAALVLLLLYVHWAPVKSALLVGKLTKTVDVQWQDASGQIVEGCDLYSGPMSLVSGYAEITLDDGAIIVVQAPCQFTLESTQQVYLHMGQIVARKTGPDEQAFLVRTPQASIVDYGTEFAVRVNAAGETETYVYEGRVQIRDSANPIKFTDSLFLGPGQGAMADSDSRLRSKPVNPKVFVRPAEMNVRYRAQKDQGYYRWRQSIYTLHRDPALMAHYFLEKSDSAPDRLLNSAGPGSEKTQGVFGGDGRNAPTWVAGRWPQKDAVRFERGKSQAIIVPASDSLSITYPLTISTWVYFPDADKWGGHLVSCRENECINYQFSLFDAQYAFDYQLKRFEFRQYTGIGEDKVGFYSEIFTPRPHTWYHFAVVYDGGQLRFFVNGELFEEVSYKGMAEPLSAGIVIGAMKKDDYILEKGDFDGIVDELMIFSRELSEQEIQAIYQAGKP